MAEQTFTTFVGLASTMMVGRLGAAALAGVGLSTEAIWIPEVIVAGVSVGATAVIARRIGEGKGPEANEALYQAVLLAVMIALISFPVIWIFAEGIMVLLQAQPDVVAEGATYIRTSAPGIVPALMLFAANAAIRGSGNTRTPMITMITANLVNVAVGYTLIYGLFGLPAMGVAGAGLASSISWTVGLGFALAVLRHGLGPMRYTFRRALAFESRTAGHILRIGYPAGLEQLQFQIAFVLFSVIIAALGTTAYAAHTVALRVENIAFMPGFGLGVAATTLVGQALGAGRPDLAERSAKLAQWYAIVLMTGAGLLMGVFRNELMAVFVADPAVVQIGAVGMVIYAFSLPLMGTSNCLAGSLRGAGDTRAAMVIMTASVWLIRLPLAYALAYWVGLGAPGAWIAAVLDINTRGFLFWWRFASGKWKSVKV